MIYPSTAISVAIAREPAAVYAEVTEKSYVARYTDRSRAILFAERRITKET